MKNCIFQGEQTATPGAPKTPGKRTLKGGLMVEDLKIGNGPEAKSGKMIGMYYSGKLKANNKQFDSNLSGKPFKFRLGKGEVIKGWDIGVEGMKVGGKRRLTGIILKIILLQIQVFTVKFGGGI